MYGRKSGNEIFASYLIMKSDGLFQEYQRQALGLRPILLAFPMLTELCDLQNTGECWASASGYMPLHASIYAVHIY